MSIKGFGNVDISGLPLSVKYSVFKYLVFFSITVHPIHIIQGKRFKNE